ncbi:uncharacterized protein P884DRAFT_279517 [Thermothelomyces heterothallicus CBS 202.75]|uniref:uncharacterized protein n=1 Tax=Thermothelomyces heterothallicus CBS 202.75 TaxID=1149848 RepID=UPI003742EB5A
MPSSRSSAQHPQPDSWMSSQMLLRPNIERDDGEIEGLNLASMGEDPLIYFLTPTPSSYVGDDDVDVDLDMDFDAGIEDAKHPPPIIRSVSPSSLGGLSRPPPRPPTPPRSPSTPDLDYSLSATPDEHEQYGYMEDSWPPPKRGHSLSLPRRLKDKFKSQLRQDVAGGGSSSPDTLAPPSLYSSGRGRSASRAGSRPAGAVASPSPSSNSYSSCSGAANSRPRTTPGRVSPHAWREPSPDVWAIEEEPEEGGMHGEAGGGGGGSFAEGEEEHGGAGSGSGVSTTMAGKARALDIPAGKPKKRVRFVLPATDDYGNMY